VLSHLGELNEIQSSSPSRMKCVSTLDVKMDNSLMVKRFVLVLTCHGARVGPMERTKEQAFSSCDVSQDVGDFP